MMGTLPLRWAKMDQVPSIDHPGLLFDKYLEEVPASQPLNRRLDDQDESNHLMELQKEHLQKVFEANKASKASHHILKQWDDLIGPLENYGTIKEFEMSTLWSLTCDLSRPSVLENANLCLHPVYGFPYLKGNSLKGITRSYATLLMHNPKHKDHADEIDQKIKRIFGCKDHGIGCIDFLDAWPDEWPHLRVETSHNQHKDYENGEKAPHDSDKITIYSYLSVAPESTFKFALLLKQNGNPDDLSCAQEWLQSALEENGYGGKTGAGHGYFYKKR